MKKPTRSNSNQFYTLAVLLVFTVGIAFRVYALFAVGFDEPFDLGGLFYQMSLEIADNGFAMPVSIPYYYPGGLPFAYPPLAFYIQAVLISLLSPRLFVTINLLPALFSVMSLFVFLLLAKEIFCERWLSLAALFIFAILPLAVTEQVQAMGLAESLGTGMLILYTLALVHAVRQPNMQHWLVAGFTLALCVVSSPGSLYAAVLISLLFACVVIYTNIKQRDPRGVLGLVIISLSGLILTAPYWLSVISNHGIGILIGAFTGQNSNLFSEIKTNLLAFRLIWATPLWNGLFLISLGLILMRRRYLLLLYTFLLLVIIRERWIISIAVSLVIGGGFGVLLDLLSKLRWKRIDLLEVSITWVLVLVLLYDAGSYLSFTVKEKTFDISAAKVADLLQIRSDQLIPAEGAVVAVGSLGLVEWSPALLKREVFNNPYGLEWIPGREEEMHHLTNQLQAIDNPLEYAPLIRQYFPQIREVYLVLDNERLEPGILLRISSNDFTILATYDQLTLIRFVLQE